jgi:hypothetical protein
MFVKFSDNNYNSILFSNLHDQSAFLSAVRQVTIDKRYQYAIIAFLGWHDLSCPAKHAPPPRGPSNSFNICTSAPTFSACPEQLGDRVASEAYHSPSAWFDGAKAPCGRVFFQTDSACNPFRINTYRSAHSKQLKILPIEHLQKTGEKTAFCAILVQCKSL